MSWKTILLLILKQTYVWFCCEDFYYLLVNFFHSLAKLSLLSVYVMWWVHWETETTVVQPTKQKYNKYKNNTLYKFFHKQLYFLKVSFITSPFQNVVNESTFWTIIMEILHTYAFNRKKDMFASHKNIIQRKKKWDKCINLLLMLSWNAQPYESQTTFNLTYKNCLTHDLMKDLLHSVGNKSKAL